MYKTGTTSLQTYFKSVREDLLAQAILYPQAGIPEQKSIAYGHHDLAREAAKAASTGTALGPLFNQLAQEIRASAPRIVILSSENFCSLSKPAILAEQFEGYDVQIYVSVRRQDEFLNAMYYTSLMADKHGLTPQEYQLGEIRSLLNYHTLVTRWRRAFPESKLSLRLYEKGRSPRTDSIADFLKITGIDHAVAPPTTRISTHRTLPARAMIGLRQLMRTNISPEDFYSIFTALHRAYRDAREESSVYAPSERLELLDEYRVSNRRLRREFYDGCDQDLFQEIPLGSDEEWSERIGPHSYAFARLLVDLARTINRSPE